MTLTDSSGNHQLDNLQRKLVSGVDYVGCPYCNRRFNEKAAQRHISFCKEQHERLPTKKTIDTTTANRANARTTVSAIVVIGDWP